MTQYLSKIFHVHREERGPVLISALFFFFVMTALMMLRPAREALGVQRGIDDVRWLFIGTAVVTLAVNPLFSGLVSKFKRLHFISATYGFFALSLLVFWAVLVFAHEAIGQATGQIFYVWFSVFNLFSVMVFWALLADRFSFEQSKRFFPLIAAGGTLGAIFGPWLASQMAKPLGTPSLLLVASGFLILSIGGAWMLTRVSPDQPQNEATAAAPESNERAIIGGSAWGGFQAVFRSRYLLGIAIYMLIIAIVFTFIYFTRLQMVAAAADTVDARTTMFANLDMITQTATLLLQLSITGYLMKRFGVAVTLTILPMIILVGFAGLAVWSSLAMVVILDAASKAVQRAVMRPARETLFTVLNREEKYKAKAFIDTFVYRGGDVIGAQVEGALKGLGMGLAALSSLVIPMALVWTVLGVWLGRQQAAKAQALSTGRAPDAPATHPGQAGQVS